MNLEHRLKHLVLDALNHHASDIHITHEPQRRTLEYRTLQGIKRIENFKITTSFFDYLKYRSNLDLFSLLRPQTRRLQIILNRKTYFLRIAYVRNLQFENMVIRIMNPPNTLCFETLFESVDVRKRLNQVLHLNSGLCLISGSTGSGKTTTLYSCLAHIAHRKVYTIEDPVEFHYSHLIQLEVNENLNFTFQDAIKQVLRHDPNVIVIGEIRDEQEAKAALRASLSGHLVISTLHANNAQETTTRMLELGVHPDYLRNNLKLILYQTLRVNETTHEREAHFDIKIFA
jgi:competence protein ComGA